MPTGVILAYSIPAGAQVLVDGIQQPTIFGFARTPAVMHEIPAGIRNVTFILPGYENVIISTDVPQGGYSTITAIMNPAK